MTTNSPLRVGIDVGGTFTDVVLMGDGPEPLATTKILNADASRVPSVISGIEKVLAAVGKRPEDLAYIAHGTTLTTNAVIERAGAKTALITNNGFRDILEIGRFSRPAELIYDIYGGLPEPLVPRHLRMTLSCRIDRTGKSLEDPSREAISKLAAQLRAEGVQAIAICFLFSFLNPSHEEFVARELKELLPDVEILTSTSVMPEFREFPRTSTTVFAAYCAPVLRAYFSELGPALASAGVTCPLYVYQSNGGIVSSDVVMANPATTLLSGPAGAITGVTNMSADVHRSNVITIDIGGTSLDISIVRDGAPEFSTTRELMGYPLGVPSLDIRAVGAGGGSVISVDEVGRVRVGPKSMGARPGPAAYGRGGSTPTLTDLNLLIGLLSPEYFAGGAEKLYPELSEAAFESIVTATSVTREDAISGVFEVAISQIANSIREMVLERGYDLRDFTLVAFGGGGPVYAAAVADSLGVEEILIPPHPGVFAALGMATADFVHDNVRSLLVETNTAGLSEALEAISGLSEQAARSLDREGVTADRCHYTSFFEMRYHGQSTELAVQLPDPGNITPNSLAESFHALHQRVYGYSVPGEQTEIVNARVRAVGRLIERGTQATPHNAVAPPTPVGRRFVQAHGTRDQTEILAYLRASLEPGHQINGPVIIDEMSSSTVVPEGWTAEVHGSGTISLRHTDSERTKA